MKRTLLLFAAALLFSLQSFAQTGVAINTTGAEPDGSAMLDVTSTEKGILIPRMTEAQRMAIALPAKGLLVYQNDSIEGFYYYDGSVWTNLSLINFTESNYTYNSRTGVKFIPNNAAEDVDLVLQPKRYGAIVAQQPDGTDTGGNRRGYLATDLQRLRTDAAKVASGNYATIVGGSNNTASGESSTAMGSSVIASGIVSTAMGGGTTASGHSSTAMGSGSTASGNYSTAMGRYTTAPSYYETALGSYNTNYTPVFSDDWDDTDRLFVVGNGTSAGSRSNALTIFKDANTIIGGRLTINSNLSSSAYSFPASRGFDGEVLTTNGVGGTYWSPVAIGTVTSVTGIAPVSVETGTTTPVISISPANTTAAGSMSAADKTRLDGLVSSQWTTSGSNIYYNAGNVGIGTSTTNGQLQFNNALMNRKIVMYQIDDNDHQFFGLGVNSNTLRYQVLSGSDSHVFYAGTSTTASDELFRIKGTGEVVIPALSTAGVLLNSASGVISSSVGTNGQVLQTDGSGGTSWATPYTGLTNFTESNFTYDSRTGVKFTPNNAASNVDLILQPKGNGAILAQQPDGTITGGNARGSNAVDLQMNRASADMVAGGSYSVIAGGAHNKIYNSGIAFQQGYDAVISGGEGNITCGDGAVIGGGYQNTANGWRSVIGGGFYNSTSMWYSVVCGGSSNQAIGMLSFVGGGISNTAQSYGESILGLNATVGAGNADSFIATDRLFVLGNGTNSSARSNALTILKNANTTIGGSLTLNGNGTGTSLTFPTVRGTNGQFLKTAGDGTTSWSALAKADVGLGNVENTALSTWSGSSNITTLGTIATGTWGGTAISLAKGGTGATTKTAAFDALSPMSAAGDLIYGGTGGTGTRLIKGTADQVLAMNADATAPEWVSLTKTDVGLTNVENTALSTWSGSSNITTLGTVATGTWNATTISLAKGGTGATTKSAAFDALSPMTTAGDIIYFDASGTATRLPKGNDGQMLVLQSGLPAWGGPPEATTAVATSVNTTSATLNGVVDANCFSTVVTFEYGTTTNYGNTITAGQSPLTGNSGSSVSAGLVGLTPGETYYYRLIAENSFGTVYGSQMSFITIVIGSSYGGGKVACIYQSGDAPYIAGEMHGLIAASADQSSGIWGCKGTNIPGNLTALGTGAANTVKIVEICTTSGIAAQICDALVLNGYSDWFLPSKDELAKLYANKVAIGGFVDDYYWSSSQSGSPNSYSWVQGFINGSQNQSDKSFSRRVRAARAF